MLSAWKSGWGTTWASSWGVIDAATTDSAYAKKVKRRGKKYFTILPNGMRVESPNRETIERMLEAPQTTRRIAHTTSAPAPIAPNLEPPLVFAPAPPLARIPGSAPFPGPSPLDATAVFTAYNANTAELHAAAQASLQDEEDAITVITLLLAA